MPDPIWLKTRNYAPEFLAAFKSAAIVTRIGLGFGVRSSFASRALVFAATKPPPSADYSISSDNRLNAQGNRVCTPYVQFLSHGIRFEFTMSGTTAVWRVREVGRAVGRTRSAEEKARFLEAFRILGFMLPNGYHCFWTPVPAGVVDKAGSYVEEFLSAISKPARVVKREKKSEPRPQKPKLVSPLHCANADHKWEVVEKTAEGILSRCATCGLFFRAMTANYRSKQRKVREESTDSAPVAPKC